MKHIEFEKLITNFEGLLRDSETEEIARHLTECEKCAAEAGKLENFFAYVKADKSEQVSQATTARLLNIFQAKKFVAAEKQSWSQRLFAKLVFDDWQTALNERYAASDSRQLLYRAAGFELDLRLNFYDGKCQLSGQIFPDCGKNSIVEIFSDKSSEKVLLNDYCEFSFPFLNEGIYNLRFSLNETVIEIENFSLELQPF